MKPVRSVMPLFWSVALALSGCRLPPPPGSDVASNTSSIQLRVEPNHVCPNDTIRFKYQTTSIFGFNCPEGSLWCAFPTYALAPAESFRLGVYPTSGYVGEIASAPIVGTTAFNVTATISTSSSTFMRANAHHPDIILMTFNNGGRPEYELVRAPTLSQDIVPIQAQGRTISLVSTPACTNQVVWSSILSETSFRSPRARVRRVCNRDPMRSVRFIASFSPGPPPFFTERIAPGACLESVESGLVRLQRLVPVEVQGVPPAMCDAQQTTALPAPIRFEVTMNCDV
jgi:hypothetical protein